MKLRCLLVDDEPPALDVLETYVRAVDTLELAGRCANAIQAFQALQQRPVDVLLLDIQLPQLLGTDLLRSLRQPPAVILTTAYPQYALDGYELDVVDYLLKPIAFERFLRAIGKVTARRDGPAAFLSPSLVSTPTADATEPAIFVRTDRRAVKVVLREVQYVESQKDYVRIVTTTDKPLLVKQSLSSLAELLPAEQFVRIHRSFIVGIRHVKSYTAQHVGVAGQELPVGGLYQREVQRVLAG